jgi:hypothetical protein
MTVLVEDWQALLLCGLRKPEGEVSHQHPLPKLRMRCLPPCLIYTQWRGDKDTASHLTVLLRYVKKVGAGVAQAV